jgi:hypothetical protein
MNDLNIISTKKMFRTYKMVNDEKRYYYQLRLDEYGGSLVFAHFDKNDDVDEWVDFSIPFDEEWVIEQWSGWTDTDGVLIFEGDLLNVNEHYEGDHLYTAENAILFFTEGSFVAVGINEPHYYYELDMGCIKVIGR